MTKGTYTLLKFGEPGSEPGQFQNMGGIRVDHENNVCVVSEGRLQIFEWIPPAGARILFDEAHSEWISIEGNYREFANRLRLNGHIVDRITTAPISYSVLADYKV
jgi:hypothetical protein